MSLQQEHVLLQGLNKQQKEAVLHHQGPLLILAGAGSGKTKVITHRIAYLIDEHRVSPAEILAITFTNKAAGEMKERVQKLIGNQAQYMWIGTFHSMLLRMLRAHCVRLGYRPGFTIVDVGEQKTLIKQAMKEVMGSEAKEAKNELQQIQSSISKAKSQRQSWQDIESNGAKDFRGKDLGLAKVYKRYEEKLRENNSLDFDDILLRAVELLEQNADVLEAYRQRFKYLLVDEYQDTNAVQDQFLKLMAGPTQNICVVGDDDQSIYSFRGAVVDNILDFPKVYSKTNIIKLEQNYRSTQHILEAANAVIHVNEKRSQKQLWTDNDRGEKIVVHRAMDPYREADYVISEILRQKRKRPLSSYSDFAILYRLNALSRYFESKLRERHIPYRIYGGLSFYERAEVKDALAYLRLISNTNDNQAFLRIINVPRRGIGNTTITKLQEISEQTSLSLFAVAQNCEQYSQLKRNVMTLKHFCNLITDMRQTAIDDELTLSNLVTMVLQRSGLENELNDKLRHGDTDAESRLLNLSELVVSAREFMEQKEAMISQISAQIVQQIEGDYGLAGEKFNHDLAIENMLSEFLESAVLTTTQDEESDGDMVKLMTVHSAKGLEFDVVFIVGAEDNIFPSSRASYDVTQMEEERRLAYVAMTRARKVLYITSANCRSLYERTAHNPPSRFFMDIDDKHAIYESEADAFGGINYSSNFDRRKADEIYGGAGFSMGSGMFDNPYGRTTYAKVQAQKERRQNNQPKKRNFEAQLERSKSSQNKVQAGKLSLAQAQPGAKVKHNRFGEGTIIEVQSMAGGNAILVIDFNGEQRKMVANSAPITLLEN